MSKHIKISNAEWEVMNVVWKGEWFWANQIVDALCGMDWNNRTVKTLIARLVKKGVLEYRVEGKRYLYRAALSRQECVRHESRSFLKRVFGGTPQNMMAFLVENEELSEKDIEDLRKILDRKKKAL